MKTSHRYISFAVSKSSNNAMDHFVCTQHVKSRRRAMKKKKERQAALGRANHAQQLHQQPDAAGLLPVPQEQQAANFHTPSPENDMPPPPPHPSKKRQKTKPLADFRRYSLGLQPRVSLAYPMRRVSADEILLVNQGNSRPWVRAIRPLDQHKLTATFFACNLCPETNINFHNIASIVEHLQCYHRVPTQKIQHLEGIHQGLNLGHLVTKSMSDSCLMSKWNQSIVQTQECPLDCTIHSHSEHHSFVSQHLDCAILNTPEEPVSQEETTQEEVNTSASSVKSWWQGMAQGLSATAAHMFSPPDFFTGHVQATADQGGALHKERAQPSTSGQPQQVQLTPEAEQHKHSQQAQEERNTALHRSPPHRPRTRAQGAVAGRWSSQHTFQSFSNDSTQ